MSKSPVCTSLRRCKSGLFSFGRLSFASGAFSRNVLLCLVALLSEGAFGQQAVTFVQYNVENYLEMNRRQGGKEGFAVKPESEKKTLVRIIKEIHPDILGVAEMGPPDQFAEFRKRLTHIRLPNM